MCGREVFSFAKRRFLGWNVKASSDLYGAVFVLGGRIMYNTQLETFICVVEAGSFSKAADKLFISPPAVIKQINSLEASLGVQLFSRTHRGLCVY